MPDGASDGAASDPARVGWQILSGAAIGTGETSLDKLRKAIKVTLQGPDKFAAEAYATREFTTDPVEGTVSLIIRLTNTGSAVHCNIDRDNDVWTDAEEAPIAVSPVYSQLFGPVDDCLEPGESGYFMFHADTPTGATVSLFDQLAGIELKIAAESRMGPVMPASQFGRLIAKKYEIDDNQDFLITYANESPKPVRLAHYDGELYLLLDDNNVPVLFDHFDLTDVTVAPGETVTLKSGPYSASGTVKYYEGQVHRILAYDLED